MVSDYELSVFHYAINRTGTAAERSLLLTLAALDRGDGAEATTADLARYTGYSTYTISIARRALMDRGEITADRVDKSGRPAGKFNVYRVRAPRVSQSAALRRDLPSAPSVTPPAPAAPAAPPAPPAADAPPSEADLERATIERIARALAAILDQ